MYCDSVQIRRTHYDTLGVARDAAQREIKNAFFSLSKSHHPDIQNRKLEPKFHEITAAYSILRDAASRHAYDITLPSLPKPKTPRFRARYPANSGAFFGSPSSTSHSSFRPPWRAYSQGPEPPRPPPHAPIPGAGDRQHRHPGQRSAVNNRTAQAEAWAAQQRVLRERKVRGPKLMVGFVVTFGTLLGLGWVMNK
ncbi:DnaJ domain-containing protein [Mycena crocata]|nr:DnaJ domain-containing protein [Mycena crocata]